MRQARASQRCAVDPAEGVVRRHNEGADPGNPERGETGGVLVDVAAGVGFVVEEVNAARLAPVAIQKPDLPAQARG